VVGLEELQVLHELPEVLLVEQQVLLVEVEQGVLRVDQGLPVLQELVEHLPVEEGLQPLRALHPIGQLGFSLNLGN